MNVKLHKNFVKNFNKRIKSNKKLLHQFESRYRLFIENPSAPLLRDHALTGALEGNRSFSINGDIRVIYQCIDATTVIFLDIGSHNQVY